MERRRTRRSAREE
ncbi:hypothetical protein E2C01_088622 [Portunus trituberculatus]|uniref:Uncharacterized protein n=1 Tax=Portunus trituberculatus TaxID=210409 RepID=A0A5B7JGJ1_PORTR|nr:hypothetical protein [Portunus trituberculatus]